MVNYRFLLRVGNDIHRKPGPFYGVNRQACTVDAY